MEAVISAGHVRHVFGTRTAVADMTFTVERGDVFGLLGPNGAGKTTTVRLLNGLYNPEAGTMRVLGFDPVTQGGEVRRRTGVLTETPALYERLTARQNLAFFADLSDLPPDKKNARIDELLAFFELTKRSKDRVAAYSKGMKQRLALARALLAHPELLFLDEPTSGLDPESAQQVHDLITGLRQQNGHTVFLCTHNLNEAERLCDRLGIMNNGRLLAVGTLDELRRLISPDVILEVELLQPLTTPDGLQNVRGVTQVVNEGTSIHMRVAENAVIPQVAEHLVRAGAQLLSLSPRQITLQEIYFTLQEQNGQAGEIK